MKRDKKINRGKHRVVSLILGMVLTFTVALALAGCSSAPKKGEDKEDNNFTGGNKNQEYLVETLKLEGGTDWGTPNPFLNESRGPGTAKRNLVYASLMEKDEKEDVSWLAESWDFEEKDYTFTLFENTTFHDGELLTTEDVAFSIDYYKENPPISNSLGAGEGFIIDSYAIKDERTITITVKEPTADTLTALGSFVIIPKHIWEQVEDPYSYRGDGYLVGSGAYKCTVYQGDTGTYEFEAYEGWVNGKQAARKIQFVPVSDPILAFENNEIDITSMAVDLKDIYMEDSTIGILEKTNDYGYKLLINYEKCPDFLDVQLRKGIYMALDRQAVVDMVFRGAGTVGSAGYVPEGSLYYNEDVVKYNYDEKAAKEILSGKGYSVMLLISDSSEEVSVGEILKNNLIAAGIDVQVKAYDSATRDTMINKGEYEFALVGNGGWGNNPPTFMRTLFSDKSKFSGTNPHSMGAIGHSSEAMTEIAEAQVFETDFQKRIEMFKDLEKIVSEEIPVFVIANKSSYSMYRKDYYDGWMKTYAYQQTEQNRLSYMAR